MVTSSVYFEGHARTLLRDSMGIDARRGAGSIDRHYTMKSTRIDNDRAVCRRESTGDRFVSRFLDFHGDTLRHSSGCAISDDC